MRHSSVKLTMSIYLPSVVVLPLRKKSCASLSHPNDTHNKLRISRRIVKCEKISQNWLLIELKRWFSRIRLSFLWGTGFLLG